MQLDFHVMQNLRSREEFIVTILAFSVASNVTTPHPQIICDLEKMAVILI